MMPHSLLLWGGATTFTRASQVALVVKNLTASAGDIIYVGSIPGFYPLEKEMATHSSSLAWRIPWTEELGGLWFIVLQGVRHDWSDLACTTFTIQGVRHLGAKEAEKPKACPVAEWSCMRMEPMESPDACIRRIMILASFLKISRKNKKRNSATLMLTNS